MSRQLTDLEDATKKQQVGCAITKAVQLSFLAPDTACTPTDNEIKRRTNICLEFYKIMRNDLRWSTTKICDQMPRALLADLTGVGVKFLDGMTGRGWLSQEKRTAAGLILP